MDALQYNSSLILWKVKRTKVAIDVVEPLHREGSYSVPATMLTKLSKAEYDKALEMFSEGMADFVR